MDRVTTTTTAQPHAAAEPMTVLVVEDSRMARARLAAMIEKMGHRCVQAENGEVALALYAREQPSLVLLDVMMPVMDGYACARRIRALDATRWTPIIFLSAAEDDQDLERGIDAGGDDYLVKPVSYVVLQAKIRAQQRIDEMRRTLEALSAALVAANREQMRLARQDGLTSLANRRHFDETLARAAQHARATGAPLSLLMLDVDAFKPYNDRYGHLAGDDALRQVAVTLEGACAGADDLAARYGGEEFAVVLPGAEIARAAATAEAIRRAVEALAVAHDRAAAGVLTVSVGVASLAPGGTREALIAAADRALYRAKAGGRNRVERADDAR